jgi:hypothetical protein
MPYEFRAWEVLGSGSSGQSGLLEAAKPLSLPRGQEVHGRLPRAVQLWRGERTGASSAWDRERVRPVRRVRWGDRPRLRPSPSWTRGASPTAMPSGRMADVAVSSWRIATPREKRGRQLGDVRMRPARVELPDLLGGEDAAMPLGTKAATMASRTVVFPAAVDPVTAMLNPAATARPIQSAHSGGSSRRATSSSIMRAWAR